MLLRKINAVLSLITTVLLINHAAFLAVWMLTRGDMARSVIDMPYLLLAVMILHAVISIVVAINGHKGVEKRPTNAYPKLNRLTNIQRYSGLAMVLFTVIHMIGAGNHFQSKIFNAIFQPLFFAIVLAHISVSASKAFITLGIGNARFVKCLDIVIKVVCVVTLIADIIGFYLYVC